MAVTILKKIKRVNDIDCYTNLWNEEELRCSMMLAPPNLNMVPADMRTETTQDEDCDTFHD